MTKDQTVTTAILYINCVEVLKQDLLLFPCLKYIYILENRSVSYLRDIQSEIVTYQMFFFNSSFIECNQQLPEYTASAG